MYRRFASLLLAGLLTAGCAVPAVPDDAVSRVDALLPADAILLGEQHDSPDHQRIHRQVIDALVARGALAAVALEMAPQGGSTVRAAARCRRSGRSRRR